MKTDSSSTPGASRLRDRLREATTGAILEAAEQVVTEQGVESTRMDEIARRAGIAVGTLYNYFADRDTLLAALHRAHMCGLLAVVDGVLTETEAEPFEARLAATLRAMLEFSHAHRQFLAQVMAVDPVAGKVRTPPRKSLTEAYLRMDTLVQHGVRAGALLADYAEFYPAVLFALVRAAMLVQFHRATATPLTDLVEPLVHLFLHGASAASPARSSPVLLENRT